MKRENYVTVEQAKALKRLGFDWECNAHYSSDGSHLWTRHQGVINSDEFASPVAPLLYVAQKWLREVKGIAINVIAYDNEWLRFKYSWNETYMQNCREKGKQWEEWSIVKHYGAHDTYEAALSEGITQILKLLEGKI